MTEPGPTPNGSERAAIDLRDLHPASKEYLESIFELEEEGQRILQARIGERLGLTPATVSEGIKRLATEGLTTVGQGREIALTDRGRAVAETLVRRHRLAERMLVDILGIPWHLCHEQAEDWEKVMTSEVEEAILAKIEGDATCPHGNPIPGATSVVPWSDLKAIGEMTLGESGRLTRLLEDVELDHDVLKYLEDHMLMPGVDVELVEVAPDNTRTLAVAGEKVALGPQLADNLWILPT
jgi:DtxR family transcriptional regulator, Mn-dependent transcriptional regulator